MQKYEVTKLFIGGILKGLTHTEKTTAKYSVGDVISKPYGHTSPYKIISVKAIEKDGI